MKKIIFLFSVLFFFSACDEDNDDDNGGENTGYPTDNLALPEEQKPLLLVNHDPSSGASFPMELQRILLEDEFGDDFNSVNLVALQASPFIGSLEAQELADELGILTNNGSLLNNTLVSATDDLFSAVTTRIETVKPLITVAHRVTKNDSAWLVDCKVKFWKDTADPERFRIESYWLANIPAYNYSELGLDLRGPQINDLVEQGDSLGQWIAPVTSPLDSTRTVISAGEEYEHKNILLTGAHPDEAFGVPIADFTPFGDRYFENDIVGTRSTPIRNYFLRPNQDTDPDNDIEILYTPVFLTVVWSVDPVTGDAEYLNSFMSTSTP
jgi:hypothetical protein